MKQIKKIDLSKYDAVHKWLMSVCLMGASASSILVIMIPESLPMIVLAFFGIGAFVAVVFDGRTP